MTNQVSESAPAGTRVLRVRIHPQIIYSLSSSAGNRIAIDARTGEVYLLDSPGTSDQTIDAVVVVSIDGVEQASRTFPITNLAYVGMVAPIITVAQSGIIHNVSVPEGQSSITTLTADNPNGVGTLLWSMQSYRPDSDKMSIDASTGVVTFSITTDYETPADYAGTYGDGVTYSTNNNYFARARCTHVESGLYDEVDLQVLVTDVAEGVVVPSGTIVPLDVGDQTYKSNYDSLYASSSAAITTQFTSPYSDINPYQSSYTMACPLAMMLATNDETYADQCLTLMEAAIAMANKIDTAGKKNWGPNSASGLGQTGFMADPGEATSYFLNEMQGGSMMALCAYIISQQSGYTGTLITRADAVITFVTDHIIEKWYARNPGYITNAINYLDPLASGSGWDQATHLGVILLCLDAHTPTAQYKTWSDTLAGDFVGRLTTSVTNGGATPVSGSHYLDTNGVIADTSHMNRAPYTAWAYWLLNGGMTKAHLEGLAKHFGSMIWNQSATPLYSSSGLGGDPYGGSTGIIYLGWHMSPSADLVSQDALDAAAAYSVSGNVTYNNAFYSKLNFFSWQMACRAIRASL